MGCILLRWCIRLCLGRGCDGRGRVLGDGCWGVCWGFVGIVWRVVIKADAGLFLVYF